MEQVYSCLNVHIEASCNKISISIQIIFDNKYVTNIMSENMEAKQK